MLRHSFALFAAVAALLPLGAGAQTAPPTTLVELYTSQGCASCPPAEALAAELAARDDLVTLSLHVNYWDYIGWKDRFASEVNTERQRQYARKLGRGPVFTPQVVVDGTRDVVGSDSTGVIRAIDAAQKAGRLRLDIRLRRSPDDGLVVSIPGAHFAGSAAVWLFRYDFGNVTRVTEGENAGRTLKSVNTVRDVRRIGTWTGLPLDIRLPPSALTAGSGGRDACVIVVQADDFGPVLGVRKMRLAPESS